MKNPESEDDALMRGADEELCDEIFDAVHHLLGSLVSQGIVENRVIG
jgi:hypothetical protein